MTDQEEDAVPIVDVVVVIPLKIKIGRNNNPLFFFHILSINLIGEIKMVSKLKFCKRFKFKPEETYIPNPYMDWRGPKQIQVKVLILGEAIKIYEIDPHNRRICDFLDRIGFPDIMSIKVNGLVQDSFYSLQDNDHLLLRPSRNY